MGEYMIKPTKKNLPIESEQKPNQLQRSQPRKEKTAAQIVEEYIKPIEIQIDFIPDKCVQLHELFRDGVLDNKINAKLLAAACHQLQDGENIFTPIMKSFSTVPLDEVKLIFEETTADIQNGNVYLVESYEKELKMLIQANNMSAIGFTKNKRSRHYYFNANIFVKYMMSRVTIVLAEGNFVLYNHHRGLYVTVDDVLIGKVIRFLMHEVKNDIWTSSYEAEILKALLLEVPIIEAFNPDNKYLNVENGMLNIYTLSLTNHSPDFYSNVRVPISYDEEEKCKLFERVIDEITQGDKSLINVIQEIFGYCLIAGIKAEKAFMFFGSGSNGKSLIANILIALVGMNNVSTIPLKQFSEQFGLEGLIGKALNIATENEVSHMKMNTESLKAIISGDPINIQRKYKTSVRYTPTCKLLFLVNTLPDTWDNTYGFYRKIEIIPFRRKFTDEDKDIDLFNKLKLELPGILNWSIIGLRRLIANHYKFSNSEAIEDMKREYEEEQNPVLKFYNNCLLPRKGVSVSKRDVLAAYNDWIAVNSIDDKGTRSNQKFWKMFKLALDKYGKKYAEKKVNGYMYLLDMTLSID